MMTRKLLETGQKQHHLKEDRVPGQFRLPWAAKLLLGWDTMAMTMYPIFTFWILIRAFGKQKKISQELLASVPCPSASTAKDMLDWVITEMKTKKSLEIFGNTIQTQTHGNKWPILEARRVTIQLGFPLDQR